MQFPANLIQRIKAAKIKLAQLEGDNLQKEGKRIYFEMMQIAPQYFCTGTSYGQRLTSYGLVSDDVPVYDQEALCGFFVYLCEELSFEYSLDQWVFGGVDFICVK